MFKKAAKLKLRFETNTMGDITTEDLYDVPLTNGSNVSLDNIARLLNKQIKEYGEESFVLKKDDSNKILELKFAIVKSIIEEKLEEIEDNKNALMSKAKKQKILEALALRESSDLAGKSTDELKDMLKDL